MTFTAWRRMPRVGVPVALTAVLVWALQEPSDVRPASEGPDRTASEPAREAAPQRTPTPDLDDDPVIVDIAIEPPSVCAGADVLVRVQLAEAYRDATVIVANAEANPAIVRTYRPGRRGIPIAVWREGQLVAERELAANAADCGELPRLLVAGRAIGPDRIEATLVSARGVKPGPRRWDFGDGTVIESEERTVTHRYATPSGRATYIVEVSGLTRDGETVVGRTHFTARPPRYSHEDAQRTERILAERERRQAELRAQEGRAPGRRR